jgi:hypothetical protein
MSKSLYNDFLEFFKNSKDLKVKEFEKGDTKIYLVSDILPDLRIYKDRIEEHTYETIFIYKKYFYIFYIPYIKYTYQLIKNSLYKNGYYETEVSHNIFYYNKNNNNLFFKYIKYKLFGIQFDKKIL